MTDDSFQTLLYDFDPQTTSVLDVCKTYIDQSTSTIITDQQFDEYAFFRTNFPKELCAVLEQWLSDGTFDDQQKNSFRICSEFLWKLTKTKSNTNKWFNQQTQLINLVEKCLNEIASYGYYIDIDGTEDSSLGSFDLLLQALEYVQCQQLLNILVKCVTSRFYTEALYRLSDVNASALSITQHFLLVTCPNYILTCDTKKTDCVKIATQMLSSYRDIFAHFLPHIKQWTIPVILSLVYPIKFILSIIQSLEFEEKKLIYQIVITLLRNKSTTYLDSEQGRQVLIYTSLCLLFELIRSDKDLLNNLKAPTEENTELMSILQDFSTNEQNKNNIHLKAFELISLLLPESEFLKAENTGKVAGFYVKSFTEALTDGQTDRADEILTGLKDLVQNDEVKQELVNQNGLPSIIKYAKQTNDDPLPLEITYAMTFNKDAKHAINQDGEFLDHIKQLRTSEKQYISQIAHGIMWKLEGEEKFQQQNKDKAQSKEQSDEKPTSYDMMISYCWAQKALCHKINDRLEKDGFSVWLDRDEMHGSIIERMAEAIEQSRFVLICMSSNYKKSANCKAEAEYAFNRKSKIVPLLVESNYKADGWLGFLAGSKIYVNFAEKEDQEFDKAYELLIAELERNGLRDVDHDKSVNSAATSSKPEEPVIPLIQTRDYLNVPSASMWTEQHVSEFLTDHALQQFIPVCESMDGAALIAFHYSCQTMPDKMYALVKAPKDESPVSLGIFFKFISRLNTYLPPIPPRKVDFQYNFIYPTTTTDKLKNRNTFDK